ncbi:hypothetical protein B0T25DRAFT_561471 [Lasiosphaeria hispida]|uniref:Uncharacterized protein n=1 Tax=Lasiosphaeria hispida TaxID=260671 RepID=A0AAJ0MJ51_9PEZI|nr:hypothetical protein B0T25DRAFT_561471 [Lasiosphaeria hispida]
MLEKRKEALAAVEKVCNSKLPSKGLIPDVSIRTVDRLAKALEDLYEPEVYDDLPRLTLIYPPNCLVGAHRQRKNRPKVIRYGIKVLRNYDFKTPANESED